MMKSVPPFQDTSMDDEGDDQLFQLNLEALQIEQSFHQVPITVMQIRVKDRRNGNFLVSMSTKVLYCTRANKSSMSYTCYTKWKDPHFLQNIHALSVYPLTSHDLYPMGLMQCNVILGNTQFLHMFNALLCKAVLHFSINFILNV